MSKLSAKKSFGQNFLNSPKIVQSMISSAGVTPGETILEVGPGKGVLTKALLENGAHVIAYELDPRMVEYLQETFQQEIKQGQLQLIQQDILEAVEQGLPTQGPYKVVANIPYYITNAILRSFLSSQQQPDSMTLLVQKEVADRIARDQKGSILGMSVRAYGEPKFITKVPSRYFSPQPKVDSAVLHINNISRDLFEDEMFEQTFFDVVKSGFAHKRKQLASNLALYNFDKEFWQKQLHDLGHNPHVRAEELSLQDWVDLTNVLVTGCR